MNRESPSQQPEMTTENQAIRLQVLDRNLFCSIRPTDITWKGIGIIKASAQRFVVHKSVDFSKTRMTNVPLMLCRMVLINRITPTATTALANILTNDFNLKGI